MIHAAHLTHLKIAAIHQRIRILRGRCGANGAVQLRPNALCAEQAEGFQRRCGGLEFLKRTESGRILFDTGRDHRCDRIDHGFKKPALEIRCYQ